MNTEPVVSKEQASKTAQEHFLNQQKRESYLAKEISTLIYPEVSPDGVSYYLAYEVILAALDPVARWIYCIDAHTGEILWNGSAIRDANYNNNGRVTIRYRPEYENDSPVYYSGVSGVTVQIVRGTTVDAQGQTNSSGYYDIDWSHESSVNRHVKGTKALYLTGTYAKILNATTVIHYHYFTPSSDYTYNWYFMKDETNVYAHVNKMHDYWTSSPFNYTAMNYQMDATVHDGDYNGWSDGTDIGFGTDRDVNWAQFSDIIYHEYTHCVVHHIYGDWIDPWPYDVNTEACAMDEAFPDYFACSKNGDALQGDGITGITGIPRDIGTNWKTPDDWVTNNYYANSRIISGACWDMRQDNDIGITTANDLVYDALRRTPRPYYYDDFLDNVLYEDDDDSDVSNGTPHLDDILLAFYSHGIYPDDSDVPPVAPQGITAVCSRNPHIDWDDNPESDFDKYYIYRKVHTGSWQLAGTTTSSQFHDSENVLACTPAIIQFQYKVKAKDTGGNYSNYSETVGFYAFTKQIASDESGQIQPLEYALYPAKPNPFNPVTTLQYDLPEASSVSIEIYNIRGQKVMSWQRIEDAGYKTLTWNSKDSDGRLVPAGLYIYRLEAKSYESHQRFASSGKMVLLK